MGARHSGREAALQMLYQLEASGASADDAIALFWRSFDGDPEGHEYANQLVRGVAETLGAIDARITAASQRWRLPRMTRVDRNLLRLGVYELEYRPDVPRAVILDEAVELAKDYGAEESGAFVNGVLNRIADDVGRKDEPPA